MDNQWQDDNINSLAEEDEKTATPTDDLFLEGDTPCEKGDADREETAKEWDPFTEECPLPKDAEEGEEKRKGKKARSSSKVTFASVFSTILTVLGWVTLSCVLLSITAAVWGGSTFWRTQMGGIKVDGSSMNQTFYNDDILVMQKVSWFHKADYGDVIIVSLDNYKDDEWKNRSETLLIKRLIAKEGDSVYCVHGTVYLKKAGESQYSPLDEPYAYYGNNKQNYSFGSVSDPYVVGAGEIFFLGDNRSSLGSSQDSRYKEGQSQLSCLYKMEDVIGTIPEWAITHKEKLEKIFFKDTKELSIG